MTNLDNNRNGGNPEFLTLTPSRYWEYSHGSQVWSLICMIFFDILCYGFNFPYETFQPNYGTSRTRTTARYSLLGVWTGSNLSRIK